MLATLQMVTSAESGHCNKNTYNLTVLVLTWYSYINVKETRTVDPLLKDTLSREDTPLESTQILGNKDHEMINACDPPSHQRTPF